jgi:hypothetical protein
MSEKELSSVTKRKAESGIVHADTEVIHESSRTRVTIKPFYIPHNTKPPELSIRIDAYKKTLSGLIAVEEKSLSLKEPAARKLLTALQKHLAVAPAEAGSYLVIPVESGVADIGQHDPKKVAAALGRVLSQDDLVEHLVNSDLSDELLTAMKGAVRLREMQNAVATLKDLLESGETKEQRYQEWCEQHSWAFGNAYVVNDEVRSISESDNLDLILPTVISGYRDVVELKRPDMDVLLWDSHHKNHYFGSEVSKALGQCHRYLDVFHEVAASGLRDKPEVVAYHPRAILVIGRSSGWERKKLKALHGLNRRLSGITVMTYDQLLAQGERLVQVLQPQERGDGDADEDDPFADDNPWDD